VRLEAERVAVGRGQEEQAARPEHAGALADEALGALDVLDHVACCDELEARVLERHRFGCAGDELDVRCRLPLGEPLRGEDEPAEGEGRSRRRSRLRPPALRPMPRCRSRPRARVWAVVGAPPAVSIASTISPAFEAACELLGREPRSELRLFADEAPVQVEARRDRARASG
jgi:hypothetical protein